MRLLKYLLIICFCLPSLALADPAIDSITGIASHGEIVTINSTGTNFGSKTSAAPLKFEQFETSDGGGSPTNNNAISTDFSYWGSVDALVSNTKQRHTNSSYAGKTSISNGDVTHFYKAGIGWGQKFYYSYWVWYQWSDDVSSMSWDLSGLQHKHVYICDNQGGPCGSQEPDPGFYQQWYWYNPDGIANNGDDYTYGFSKLQNNGSGTSDSLCVWEHDYIPRTLADGNGAWIHVAIQIDSGDYNTSNGSFEYWVSNHSLTSAYFNCISNNQTMRVDGDYDTIQLGWGIWNGTNTMTIYFDDIYLDTGWSRVEIGDASTYDNCTWREIQPPTSWSTSQIEVTFNQGFFENDDTAYVYVVDSDGNVNATGYEITIGSSDTTAPTGNPSGVFNLTVSP